MNLFLNVSFVHFFLPFRLYALLRNANSRRRWITGHTAHWRKALGNSTHLSASLHCVLCICTTSHSVYMKCDRNTQKLEKCHTQLLLMHIISIQGISISKINIDPKIWRLDYQLVLNCHNTAQFSPTLSEDFCPACINVCSLFLWSHNCTTIFLPPIWRRTYYIKTKRWEHKMEMYVLGWV